MTAYELLIVDWSSVVCSSDLILIKHLPNFPFLMDADMARRFHKRFAAEEELWRSDDRDGHLMIAASFSMGASGLAQIFEMSVLPVTREWLPYEGLEERSLVTHAVEDQQIGRAHVCTPVTNATLVWRLLHEKKNKR